MIPSDNIRFNDDGSAWWVVRRCPEPRGQQSMHTDCHVGAHILDQPCDTCDGEWNWVRAAGEDYTCPDCGGTGRHVFTITIADERRPWPEHHRTFCVSVVPDMVLPIYDWNHEGYETAYVEMWMDESFHIVRAIGNEHARETITLPPAAKPGMWAVKLAVHQ